MRLERTLYKGDARCVCLLEDGVLSLTVTKPGEPTRRTSRPVDRRSGYTPDAEWQDLVGSRLNTGWIARTDGRSAAVLDVLAEMRLTEQSVTSALDVLADGRTILVMGHGDRPGAIVFHLFDLRTARLRAVEEGLGHRLGHTTLHSALAHPTKNVVYFVFGDTTYRRDLDASAPGASEPIASFVAYGSPFNHHRGAAQMNAERTHLAFCDSFERDGGTVYAVRVRDVTKDDEPIVFAHPMISSEGSLGGFALSPAGTPIEERNLPHRRVPHRRRAPRPRRAPVRKGRPRRRREHAHARRGAPARGLRPTRDLDGRNEARLRLRQEPLRTRAPARRRAQERRCRRAREAQGTEPARTPRLLPRRLLAHRQRRNERARPQGDARSRRGVDRDRRREHRRGAGPRDRAVPDDAAHAPRRLGQHARPLPLRQRLGRRSLRPPRRPTPGLRARHRRRSLRSLLDRVAAHRRARRQGRELDRRGRRVTDLGRAEDGEPRLDPAPARRRRTNGRRHRLRRRARLRRGVGRGGARASCRRSRDAHLRAAAEKGRGLRTPPHRERRPPPSHVARRAARPRVPRHLRSLRRLEMRLSRGRRRDRGARHRPRSAERARTLAEHRRDALRREIAGSDRAEAQRAAAASAAAVATFAVGDAVRITAGPFANFTGTVREASGPKLRVEVSIFGRTTPVDLPPEDMEKAGA